MTDRRLINDGLLLRLEFARWAKKAGRKFAELAAEAKFAPGDAADPDRAAIKRSIRDGLFWIMKNLDPELFVVSGPIVEILEEPARKYPQNQPLQAHLFPVRDGLLFFDRPIPRLEGGPPAVRAIRWKAFEFAPDRLQIAVMPIIEPRGALPCAVDAFVRDLWDGAGASAIGSAFSLRWLVTILEFMREKTLIPGDPVPIPGRFRNRSAARIAPPPVGGVRIVTLRERVRKNRCPPGASGRRLGVRHWRSAHWTTVRYGPGRELSRQHWQGVLLIGDESLPMKPLDERLTQIIR